jgi:ERF superfamily
MQRSSESIGAIAAALAKAQAELSNPEKSLIGIIGPSTPREPGRAFRYAPLSSGLEIVRKSLGRHAIAIVQSTAIDQEAGLVRLNTVLAHASGEWVASEWPVCRIGDMASPQRMGAALTYARRYALFTLVGIAGEDDLDAPDLGDAPQDPESASPPVPNGQSEPRGYAATGPANGSRGRKRPPAPKMLLQPDASAVLLEQLLIELAAIATADEAAMWAQRKLPAKNTLTPHDADVIEQAFRAKLQSLEPTGTDEAASITASPDQGDKLDAQSGPSGPKLDTGLPPDTIIISDAPKLAPIEEDQGAAALTKPVRKRDKAHRDFVCSQPCLICGRRPSDAHHIRFGQPRALGRKVSDEFTVPLCRVHHRDLHRRSDEKAWWEAAKIEPMAIAQRLWRETRDNTP